MNDALVRVAELERVLDRLRRALDNGDEAEVRRRLREATTDVAMLRLLVTLAPSGRSRAA